MRVLREGGLGSLALAGLAVVAAAAIWSAVVANDKIDEQKKMLELGELQRSGLLVQLDVTKGELKLLIDNPVTQTIYRTITEQLPGKVTTEIVEVIKWKTKTVTVKVPVDVIKTVFHCDAEEPVEIAGDITGEILKVKTKRGNIIINGRAECIINDVPMFESEFDWDATEAWALNDRQRRKRWSKYLGLQYGLSVEDLSVSSEQCESYDCTTVTNFASADRFRFYGGVEREFRKLLFWDAQFTLAVGLFYEPTGHGGTDTRFEW